MVIQGSRLVFYGSRSIFMGFQDSRLVFHGFRMVFTVIHGSRLVLMVLGWFFMNPGGFPWFFRSVFHGSSLVFHDSWSVVLRSQVGFFGAMSF